MYVNNFENLVAIRWAIITTNYTLVLYQIVLIKQWNERCSTKQLLMNYSYDRLNRNEQC